MTVETTTRKQSFAGGQSDLTFTFKTLPDYGEYIKVVAVSSGVETVLTYGVDYTVALETDGVGGVVTVAPSYGTEYTYTVYRETTDTQESDYEDYNQFPANTLETDLDRRALVEQETAETLSRAIRVGVSSALSGSALQLPSPVDGRALVWSGTTSIINSTYAADSIATIAINYATTCSTQAGLAAASAALAGVYANTASNMAATASAEALVSASHSVTALTYSNIALSHSTTALTGATDALSYSTTALTYSTIAGSYSVTALTYSTISASYSVTALTYSTISESHSVTALTYSTMAGSHATTAYSHSVTALTYSTVSASHSVTALTYSTIAESHSVTALTYSTVAESHSVTSLTNATLAGNYATTCATIAALLPNAALEYIIDGGGETIETGIKGDLEVPFNCTIGTVTLLANTTGSIVIDVWSDALANFPPDDSDSITASAAPSISTATYSQDSTLTGWTTSVESGSTLRFNVDSVTDISRVTLSLKVQRY